MSKFLSGLTQQQAETISRELMRTSTGNAIEYSGTEYLLSRIKHVNRDEWALIIPENVRIPLMNCENIEASINILLNLFDAVLTEQEKIDLPALVRYRKSLSKNEQVIYLHEIEPIATKERQKTQEEMKIDGWFDIIKEDE